MSTSRLYRRRSEAGQVLPLVGLCLMTLLGFGGVGVDVGFLEYRQQAQQSATDAAAAGGAEALLHAGCPNQSAAQSAAYTNAANNGFINGGSVAVAVHNPPANGPYSGNPCSVFVQVTSQNVPTFFERLFGYATATETTQAAASVIPAQKGACIYLLSNSSWSSFNNATVNAAGCAIAINYSADFNGGTISSPSIGIAGPSPNMGGTTFTEATPGPAMPVADPCPEIPGCAYLAANPPSISNCQSYNSNGHSGTIYPGCYSGLNLDGGTITFAPGLYVLDGNFNDNQAVITGTGVTLYVPAGANGPNFDNQSVSLSPPTSGNEAGVLYYQVPSNTSSINFNGPNVNMTGLIYAPGSTGANFDDQNGNYVILVFGSMNFNQNSAYDFATPSPNQALIKQAVVSE
ncbi:MAG: hypothetical protein JOZ77_01300 [Candidatus Eremiobacteraeota bacterium]|nr:hypothetical protein [Candidatus Eremiobacteraeota bacterium]